MSDEICPECWGSGDDEITGDRCYRCDGAGSIYLGDDPEDDDWDTDEDDLSESEEVWQ